MSDGDRQLIAGKTEGIIQSLISVIGDWDYNVDAESSVDHGF
jgi:hypothetical protein